MARFSKSFLAAKVLISEIAKIRKQLDDLTLTKAEASRQLKLIETLAAVVAESDYVSVITALKDITSFECKDGTWQFVYKQWS